MHDFRCLKDVTVKIDALTVIIGRNGSGKSAFLRTLAMFFRADAASIPDYKVKENYEGEC